MNALPNPSNLAGDGGKPDVSPERDATAQPPSPTFANCAAIATNADVLATFAVALRESGLVGEERLAKLLYLAVTTRLMSQPVSVAVKGPSSSGKSYVVGKVLGFFPEEAYHELSAMSERALVYSDVPLRHRFLVLYEAAGIRGEFVEYLIRSLLSEGRLRYETVEKSAGGAFAPRLIEREGPTGLLITTTLASMHPENETRYLSVTVADTPEQTQHILRRMADAPAASEFDAAPWRTFQRWLESKSLEVSIPFIGTLVELIPPVAVRLRRDVAKVLALICAHALIHQATRNKDAEGRVVAQIDDYQAVYELVADLISSGVEATVPPAVRETVAAVAAIAPTRDDLVGVSVKDLAKTLGIDKSSASRRVKDALQKGYLDNLEQAKGKRARLVLGDPLPDDRTILPSPQVLEEALRGCTVAGPSGGKVPERGEDVADTP